MLPRPIAAILAAVVLAGVHAGPCKPAGSTSLSTDGVETASTAISVDTTTVTSSDESTTMQAEDQTLGSSTLTIETTSTSQSTDASSSESTTTREEEQSPFSSDSATSTLETTSSSQDESSTTLIISQTSTDTSIPSSTDTSITTTVASTVTSDATTSTTSAAPPCVEADNGDNLFRNPSFDSICNANEFDPAPWTVDSPGTVVSSYTSGSRTLTPNSGNHLLSFYSLSNDAKYLQQTIHNLEAGRKYLFTAYISMKVEVVASGKPYRLFKIDGTSYNEDIASGGGVGTWSKQYAVLTPTSNTMDFAIGWYCSGSWRSSVFIDNLSLVPYSPRCTRLPSTPSGKFCELRGAAQQATGHFIGNGGVQTTVEFCAETCRQTNGCVAFHFTDNPSLLAGACWLYTAPVVDLEVSSTGGPTPAYYDVDCFECSGSGD